MKNIQNVKISLVKENAVSYQVTDASDAKHFLQNYLQHEDKEHFVCLLLDTKNKIVATYTVAIGTSNQCVVEPREVFKAAILSNSSKIILGHNHPTGDVFPSTEDVEVTKRLVVAGKILGIEVLDHIIVSDNSYYSFLENDSMCSIQKGLVSDDANNY